MTALPSETDRRAQWSAEFRALAKLSAPLIASYAGNQLMTVTDTIFVAHVSDQAVGGVGIGDGLFGALLVFGIGLVLALDPLISQSLGAGEPFRARAYLQRGFRIALVSGLILTALLYMSPLILRPLGVDPELAKITQQYLLTRAPSLTLFLLFCACRSYLQARGTTRQIVMAMVVANVVNVLGNALFVFGDESLIYCGLPPIGLPALGVVGAGLASTLATLLSFGMIWVGLRALDREQFGDRSVSAELSRANAETQGDANGAPVQSVSTRAILRIGLPLACQLLAEVGVFALAGMLAGRIGDTQEERWASSAAHRIAITVASFTFTVTLGIGAAAAVRVGRAIGKQEHQGDPLAARIAGWTAIYTGLIFMTISSLVLALSAPILASLLAKTDESQALAVHLLRIAAVFQLVDGVQAVAAGALRGAGDTRASLVANVIGHYVIGLPISLIFAFHLGWGAQGLWWGLSAGLAAVAIGLAWRFGVITKRSISRVA